MKNYLLSTVLLCLVLVSQSFAQTRTITGTITSADDGETIPSVTVQLKGTTRGAISDFNGKYSIDVPQEGGILVFSFIGLNSQEVTIGNQTTIDVALSENVQELGEIVVTGVASATPKKKLPFTVSSVDDKVIQQVPARDAGSALVGKIAGVRVQPSNVPGSGPAIQLRGATALFGNSSPLIVLDGMLIEGTLANINLQDVERMEILKGASAATLFGSRAANGVIQIFTKRGDKLKMGSSEVMVRNEVGFETLYKGRIPDKARAHSFLLDSNGEIALSPDGIARPDPVNIADNPFNRYQNHLEDFFNGSTVTTNYVRIQNRGASGNTAVSFEHQQASGGIDIHEGNRRFNARFNNDQKIGDRLKLSTSFIWTHTNNDNRNRNVRTLFMMDPSADLFEENDNGTPYKYNVNRFNPTSEFNPFYQLVNNPGNTIRRRIVGNVNGDVSITSNLTFTGNFGIDTWDTNSKSFQDIGYLANQGEPGRGSISHSWSDRTAIVSSARLTYVKRFGDLNLRSTGFYQHEDNNGVGFNVSGFNLGVPGFDNYNNVTQSENDGRRFLNAGSSNTSQVRADNFSFSVGGDYKDRYLFDGVIRRDGVSLFGPEARWQTFFRGSLGWRVTEDFQIPNVQELKLAASYGTAGGRPGFNDRFEIATLTNGALNFPSQLANPFLRPNTTTEVELTLTADFLNRFNFLASYSFQDNADQIIGVPVSAITGRTSQVRNAAAAETNTIELTLGYQAIQQRDLGLDFTLIFDRTRQEITEWNRPDQQVGGLALWRRQGGSVSGMYGMSFVRSLDDLTLRADGTVANVGGNLTVDDFEVNREGFVIRKGTEFTNSEQAILVTDEKGTFLDNILIGDAQPDFNMSLLTNFRYKKFGVWMQWEWNQGGDVYNQGAQWMARDQLHPIFDQSMYPEGQGKYTSFFSSLYSTNRSNDFWLEDGTSFRLRELAVNYDITNDDMNKIGIGNVFKSAKFSFIGRNLLLFTDYSGFDPNTGGFITRIDNFNYPFMRNFSGALTLTF